MKGGVFLSNKALPSKKAALGPKNERLAVKTECGDYKKMAFDPNYKLSCPEIVLKARCLRTGVWSLISCPGTISVCFSAAKKS